jgi:hypothetical protein
MKKLMFVLALASVSPNLMANSVATTPAANK